MIRKRGAAIRKRIEIEGGFLVPYRLGTGWWAYANAADGGPAWKKLVRTRAQGEEFIASGGKGGWRPGGAYGQWNTPDGKNPNSPRGWR